MRKILFANNFENVIWEKYYLKVNFKYMIFKAKWYSMHPKYETFRLRHSTKGESPPQARNFCDYFCFFQGFVRQNWAPQAKILRSISGIHKDQLLFENHYYLRILFANTTIWEYYLRIAIFANSHHVKTSLFEKILFENVFWHQIIENGTLFENFEFSNSFRYYLRTWLFENFEFIICE